MGGYIKVTLREKNRITTNVLDTSVLDKLLANYQNIFDNDIADEINNLADKQGIVSSYHDQIHALAPFSYGYLFIDRTTNKVFFINDYNAITFFSNFNFTRDIYLKLKNKNFKMNVKRDYDSSSNTFKKLDTYDVRKEFVTKDLVPYLKLGTAIPYIEKIVSIDQEIKDISSIESILDELILLRNSRKRDESDYINDLIVTKFKDWEFIEDNSTKESYKSLYSYLKTQNILSEKDIILWRQEISDV